MNILLAEDDDRLGELIVHMLKKKGNYHVDWVTNGKNAYDQALQSHYDVVILDWMMPIQSGLDVCKSLREVKYTGAILMLTAKDAVHDRVQGLDAGADDYLVKPFEFEELLARIRALSRRNYAPIMEEKVEIQGLELNRTNYTVKREEIEVQLTPREFQLLDLLVKNKGRVLTREVILDRVWGYYTNVSDKTIDATVKLIRKKLELFNQQELIISIRGVGYKIEG
ncbi:response regulator transcription factor [Tepidibacillus infernus]|uniref:Two-component system response regulator n=1 Tax=Tepidibacillus decaturensis TaxID=1413211 RepID=A0A135L5F1_9BACI|nr:response regulator transcription factor [Tepidibacillus decaturensis]KXG44242.1 two-component system response regulator [Tepidibacillus decaturensis]